MVAATYGDGASSSAAASDRTDGDQRGVGGVDPAGGAQLADRALDRAPIAPLRELRE